MRKKRYKEIAYKDNTISIEKLPYPIVLYPGFYGTFFGFKKTEKSPIVLCSCSKEAIENYIKFRLSKEIPQYSNPCRMFILDSMDFPETLVRELIDKNITKNDNVIDYLSFENKLCHECNCVVPKYRYCHEMYGGTFVQNFGWYINKKAYEFGIDPKTYNIISEVCPQEILDLIKYDPVKTWERYQELKLIDRIEAERLIKELQRQNRKIWNIIENEVRIKFGHKKIGESWTSETILYYIIKSIFPDKTIIRHFRLDFLKGLELDIFIEEFKLGIEYQGMQHFKPVDYWGGEEAFLKLKERDKRKKEICKSLGIKIIYFKYNQSLSPEFVLEKIKEYCSN